MGCTESLAAQTGGTLAMGGEYALVDYFVMPTQTSDGDLIRMKPLSRLFRVGLAAFDPRQKEPGSLILARDQRFSSGI
ncbi:MAG: hypothetical protein FLDDKLPJ_01242 [Phycisphaerae bacterium]|nr:hypothetical protein [Phycisphaerae bacterium]